MKNTKALFCTLLSVLMLSACGSPENIESSKSDETTTTTTTTAPTTTEEPKEENKPSVQTSEVFVDLKNGMPENWECADGWTNGSMFNVTWRKDNVIFKDDVMTLMIDKDKTPSEDIPYSGGEFRSKEFYSYGRFEVSMKPIRNDGVVSSFFTYTGPSDNNPWDEIDIEFLGKDTTKVQFNYFTNGRGNHETVISLGFDASEEFHTYAFEWHKDSISWFVDGFEVHTVKKDIPSTPSKIMMNTWCGEGVDSWLNPFDDTNLPLTAEYQWIKFTPFDE